MKLRNLSGASVVSHAEHGEATVGDDGLFELPHEFAQALLAIAPSQWLAPHQHAAQTHALNVVDLYDPRRIRAVLDKLRARIAAVKAGEAEPPTEPWEPDPTTVGLLSAIFRSEHRFVDEFWELQIELENARPQLPASAGDEPPAGSASRSAGSAGSSGKGAETEK